MLVRLRPIRRSKTLVRLGVGGKSGQDQTRMGRYTLSRSCPSCGTTLAPLAVRCSCGTELPEARDNRPPPDEPRCAVCKAAMTLMAQQCPSCKAVGYPAMRPRMGKKSLRASNSLDE